MDERTPSSSGLPDEMDLEASPAGGGAEDKAARRAIHTLRGRQEGLEALIADVRREVGDTRAELRVGFSLLGYDVAQVARARAAEINGLAPPAREPSHPAIEAIEDAADKLSEGADKFFQAVEAHTRPDSPAPLRQTDSERLRKLEAERVGKRVLKIWDGVLVEVVKVLLFSGAGALIHYLATHH